MNDSVQDGGAPPWAGVPCGTRPQEAVATDCGEGPARPAGEGELILVVDDEATIRQLHSLALRGAGYRVLTASNGAEGVAAYARQPDEIDVVLTDLLMPVMDGPAMILALRQLTPDVKVVVVSGFDGAEQLPCPADLGVRALVTKPNTVATLLKTVRAVLEGP